QQQQQQQQQPSAAPSARTSSYRQSFSSVSRLEPIEESSRSGSKSSKRGSFIAPSAPDTEFSLRRKSLSFLKKLRRLSSSTFKGPATSSSTSLSSLIPNDSGGSLQSLTSSQEGGGRSAGATRAFQAGSSSNTLRVRAEALGVSPSDGTCNGN
ncbi:hypothetical protein EV182_008861, partial [Spiromyces aspiralis]